MGVTCAADPEGKEARGVPEWRIPVAIKARGGKPGQPCRKPSHHLRSSAGPDTDERMGESDQGGEVQMHSRLGRDWVGIEDRNLSSRRLGKR